MEYEALIDSVWVKSTHLKDKFLFEIFAAFSAPVA